MFYLMLELHEGRIMSCGNSNGYQTEQEAFEGLKTIAQTKGARRFMVVHLVSEWVLSEPTLEPLRRST